MKRHGAVRQEYWSGDITGDPAACIIRLGMGFIIYPDEGNTDKFLAASFSRRQQHSVYVGISPNIMQIWSTFCCFGFLH